MGWTDRTRQVMAALLLALSVALPVHARVVHPLVGRAAPDLLQHLLTGPAGNFRLADHRGDVVVIGFWTSWCSDCRDYLNRLAEMDRTYARAGLVVLGVGLDQDADAARQFVGRLTLRTSNDQPETVGRNFDVADVPMTVLIDRDGVVRYVHVGQESGQQAILLHELKNLLDE